MCEGGGQQREPYGDEPQAAQEVEGGAGRHGLVFFRHCDLVPDGLDLGVQPASLAAGEDAPLA